MQELKKIYFTKENATSLYNNYAKLAFCDAVRLLMRKAPLDQEEKDILVIATGEVNDIENFYRKSHIIYLSNRILLENDIKKIEALKKQLIFELAVGILDLGLEKKVFYPNEDKSLFSLYLNQKVNAKFDSIAKNGKVYAFYKNGKEALRLEKNRQCTITENVDFLEKDKNPFNENNDHPDAPVFTPYDLKNIPKEEWVRQFREAYSLIKEKVPEIYDEIHNFLDAIVPHGYEKGKQLSSSYSKSPGILYLSYTDKDITQAEAIIHEVHHTIFNVIAWKYILANNDRSLKYYSAYRPDARHIHGCFIGLHAFVAVQNFYRRLIESNGDAKNIEAFFTFYLKNAKVIAVLEKYADFTDEGNLLFNDIKTKYFYDKEFFYALKNIHSAIYDEILQKVNEHLEEAKKRNKILLH
ncbi:hypothetical protein HYU09_02575 [Candidatus Woesearchaeota archaeon]|nr:hypothetical protein [Candidatus Woesearchaeota archaeon]